ncbi:amino acid adenylation domain-containing protein, partial [Janthinobacterium sp. CG_23.3]
PDGAIECLGRMDHQVKIRGFRIELGEIETALAAQDGVREAVVLAREDAPGEQRLVAYLVTHEDMLDSVADTARLRAALAHTLPDYMIPAHFVLLPRMPLTPNGKVERKALPAPDLASSELAYVGPRTPEEEILAGIWAEVLQRGEHEQIGVHEHFFHIGGHSLLATQVMAKLRAAFQLELPLRALFDATTIETLAQRIVQARREQGAGGVPAIAPADRNAPLALSFGQQRLWFLDQFESGSALYNLPAAVRLSGSLDGDALERSLNEIVRRHEALRTRFASVDGNLRQIIAAGACALAHTDLRGLPHAEREAKARWLAQDEAQTPFDLDGGALLRARLIRLEPAQHIVLLTMHHIASDGWSLGVLVRELVALYTAYSQQQASPLPELAIQYADFAQWQRQYLQGEALEQQVSYWKNQLGGAPTLLTLPTDRARPASQSYRGASLPFVISQATTAGLHALSRQARATLFMTLAAAFNVLLARHAGQSDICIGTPIANRQRAELEPLIGFFVNTLVLRTQVDGNAAFSELLQQVRATALGAYAHQDLPFEQLVEALNPERHASHAPLFQVMLVLQNAPLSGLALPGLTLEALPAAEAPAKFDLTWNVREEGGQLLSAFEYSTDLFDATTIERMAGRLTRLLDAVVAEPDMRVADLPLLPDAERRQLLVDWNDTARVYPRDTLQGMVEAQAARTPDRVAVAFEGRELSYAELNGRANRLAHYLREQGVGPDRLVGICAERSLDMVTGLLAILKAGGAYVPLDPGYPTERLATILKDAAPVVLLGERRVLERLAHAGPAFCLDTQDTALAAYPAENPPARALPRNLAYVIYTSGSTGKPKGVGIDQAGIVNRLQWMQEAYALTAADRVLQKTPFSFDVSVWEFFWPLAHGATLVVAKPGGHQEPAYLAELIEAQGVTTLHFVPPMLDVFLQTLATPTQAARCRSLRLLICSGQALPLALQQRCLAQLPQAALHNLYGPTEASVDVTFWRCRDDAELACVPIGAPIANTQIYILDRQLNPVPAGVAGELHIGGVGLARGYLNRPDLTAAQFIPHPFSAQPGARLYKSGDLARYLPDGQIEYLGRLDHQVKLRGLRIELGEIEAALTAQDGVREAVVLAREDAPGEQRLVAYLVAHEDRPGADVADTARLRAALARTLPDYMIPAHFVLLPRMPLTPNGKVERKALPAPDLASSELAYVGPRTPEEEILAGIWAEVLQRGEHEQIGVHEHFFHIGGHSLLATQVVSKLRAAFQLELPLRALFDATTIETLAQRIVQARREQGAGVPAIAPADRNAPLALSFGQQRLWFLDQFESGGAVYNVPAAVRLSGSLDGDALERSLNEIVRRHEALRTRFASVDGNPRQIIAAAAACALAHTDLSGLPHAEREAKAGWLAQDEAQTPFDLDGGALLRARLIRLEPEQHIVLLTMHHIASDGWSLGVLVRELVALYTAYSQQRASPLPELAIQYADFAQWQRQWLQGEALEQQVSYWKNQLGGAPTLLTLPTDRARPASQSYRGASLPFVISQATTAGLHALSRQARATLFMTLAAAFNVLLARHAGQSDICIGTPIANRQRAELEPLIGFFVNTLVLRTQVDGDAAFSDLLQQVRATALGAYAHQDLPFEQLVEALNPERHASHAPLFQVMLALQNAPMSGLALPGLTIEVLPGAEAPAKFDLTWNVREEGGQLLNTFEYSTDLFDAATMQRMAGHLTRLLEAVVAEPGTRVADLPLLRDAERDQLLVAWNQTGQAYPTELCVEQLFEAQVARTPERVALSCAGVELSYAQLNQRANRVAHLLRRRGIGPGAVVGVCLERNADLIVALLAVLKAGAAYLPLDPDYPRERIAFMLDDAGVALVLAHARFQDLLSTCQAPIALVDEQLGQAEAGDNPAPLAGARDLAYVIYTSGSTGQPKGVAIEHRATVTLLHWARDTFTPEQRAGMLASTSVCFDLSVFEIFVPLSWGGRILLIENALHLPALQDKSALTFINTVPSAMTELVRMGQVPASVKVVGLAGEPLQNALVQSIYQAGVDSVYNLYGPSEDTTYSTFVRLERGSTQAVSIGRPIANTRLYILDARMEPVPLGVAGELYIGGDGLARGYLHRAELTREKFIADPFSADPAARLYKTGDLVRYRADGQVDFLGRLDHQVKLRGYRIELGDIEAALLAHGQVREAVLQVREDQPGDRRLVAYLVAATAEAPGAAELRAFLQDKLPGYMIPSAFVPLPRMPLTPNGKIDRKALPAPQGAALASAAQYLAPASATEKQVAAVWQTVLGVERVGVHDNFFDLGGHSLLAIQLVARLRDAVSIDIPLHTLFQAPGLAEFSQRIDTLRAQAGGRVSAIPRVSRDAPLPLSFAQQGVWFMHRFEGANPAYSMPAAIRLEGHLDTALLQLAFNEIIRRHEVLRTTFPEVDGQATQKVGVAFNLDIPLVDLSGRHVDAAQDAMRQAMKQLALHRFDLATGPLIQVALFRLGAREHVLFLNPHHIVFDGWSMHILIREMGALYQALLENKASPLPELPIQYGDFAHWQRTCLQGEEWASQLQYWQRQLAHAPVLLALPTDRPRPEVQTFESSMVHFEVSAELLTRLKHISQQAGVTLFMTLLSAFGTLLSVYSRQSDIVIGSPIANRVRTEVESLIGFFVNTLVLRIDLAGDPLFMTLLERVKRVTLEAYAHQDVPFEKLVDVLRPQRSVSHTPIFQVWFNYQSNVDVNLTLPDLQMTPLYLDETVAKFDVMLNLTETGSTLAGSLACNAQLFDAYTVTQLSVMFGISLEEIANRTELAVSELGAALDNKMRVINAEKNTQLASADRELLHGLINKRRNKQTVVKK